MEPVTVSTILVSTLASSFVVFTVLWLIHVRLADASLVDWWWGAGFGAIAVLSVALANRWSAYDILFAALVVAWALRLTVHMVARHLGNRVEDPRYAAMRLDAGPGWWWQNLAVVFWLQALLQWLIASPIHAGLVFPAATPNGALVAVGALVFLVGFGLETAADLAIRAFRADPANRGRLLTTGLFAVVRHPNYLGEITAWWGLGLVGFALSGAWWAFAGPALLHLLIARVSGVPLLDKAFRERPGYADWAATTPALLPFPRPQPKRTAVERPAAE